METELAGDKQHCSRWGGRPKHPRSFGCRPSACCMAEAKNLRLHRGHSRFLQACLTSPWVFPGTAHHLLPALKCVPHPRLFSLRVGAWVPCLTVLQCLHADRSDHWVNLYTCMCFITAMFHFFHHDPSISLHTLKPVQISKRNPFFFNKQTCTSFQII